MKVKHFPTTIAHSPWFILRNGARMLAHTFTGSTWRSVLGLESEREVFARFRAARRAERGRYAGAGLSPDPVTPASAAHRAA